MFIRDLQFLDRVDLASIIKGGVSADVDASTNANDPSASLSVESVGKITRATGRIRITNTPKVNTALAIGYGLAYDPDKGLARDFERSFSRKSKL